MCGHSGLAIPGDLLCRDVGLLPANGSRIAGQTAGSRPICVYLCSSVVSIPSSLKAMSCLAPPLLPEPLIVADRTAGCKETVISVRQAPRPAGRSSAGYVRKSG